MCLHITCNALGTPTYLGAVHCTALTVLNEHLGVPCTWVPHVPRHVVSAHGPFIVVRVCVRRGQADPRAVEELKAAWQGVVYDGAARRGLEADSVAVMVAEMRDVPPPGVAGPQQLRDWLDQSVSALQR